MKGASVRKLQGWNALITGASRGIGVHIARALAAQGVNMGLVARSAEPLERLASELRAHGGRVHAFPADLTVKEQRSELLADVERELGQVDLLVNNAGLYSLRAVADSTEDELEAMLQLNALVPMALTRSLLPGMLARRRGHIVSIGSLAGKSPIPFEVGYAATKAAVGSFTTSLRVELHGSGVSASLITPGFVAGEGMFADMAKERQIAQPSALVGMTTPQKVAAAVVRALVRDEAEIAVNPGPVRLLHAVTSLAPGFGGWFMRSSGLSEMLRKGAVQDGASTRAVEEATVPLQPSP